MTSAPPTCLVLPSKPFCMSGGSGKLLLGGSGGGAASSEGNESGNTLSTDGGNRSATFVLVGCTVNRDFVPEVTSAPANVVTCRKGMVTADVVDLLTGDDCSRANDTAAEGAGTGLE